MARITMALDQTLALAFDEMYRDRDCRSCSQAMRDVPRRKSEMHGKTGAEAQDEASMAATWPALCVATLDARFI